MRRAIPLVLTGFAIVLVAACGSVTEKKDGSGQGGTSGQAGSGGGATAGTTGQAGSTAGTTGRGGTTGQGGSGPGGGGGTIGSAGTNGNAGRGGTTGSAGTNGSAGRGGTTGNAGTNGSAGRGGTTGNAGTNGSAGRGGTTGSAGTNGSAGRGGTTGSAGRGGQGGGGLSCSELEAEYSKAVQDARECTPNAAGQCQQLVDTGLSCPGCQVRVTDTTGPDAIRTQWNKAGCTPPIFCPAIICVVPGPGVCTRSDASGSGGICTMNSGGIDPV